MFVKNLSNCPKFTANDGCKIQEWLHPKNDPVDVPYSVAVATVAIGQSTHQHKLNQTEVYLILNGEGLLHVADQIQHLKKNDAVLIPGNQVQWVENIGDIELTFMAIVSPPWTEENDELV